MNEKVKAFVDRLEDLAKEIKSNETEDCSEAFERIEPAMADLEDLAAEIEEDEGAEEDDEDDIEGDDEVDEEDGDEPSDEQANPPKKVILED